MALAAHEYQSPRPRIRRAAALTAGTLMVLLVLLPAAARALSQPVVTISPSAAVGARTTYTISFAVAAGLFGAKGDTVTITFPGDTGLTSVGSSTITDAGKQVGGDCSLVPGTPETERCIIFNGSSVTAGDTLIVTLNGIVNPSKPTTDNVLQVSTTQEPQPQNSASYTTVAQNPISKPSVTISPPSPAVGARTTYSITFATSSTGGMSGAAGSTITITFPGDTGLTALSSNAVIDAGRQVGGDCSVPSGSETMTCIIFNGAAVRPTDRLTVTVNGVINPSTPADNNFVTVSTSSDTASVGSAFYGTAAQNPISQPSVTISPPSAAVSARTTYSITFTTSTTGGLSGAAGSSITLTFPGDTGLAGLSSNAVIDAGKQVGGDCSLVPGTAETMTCIIFNGSTVNAGDTLSVTLNGVINPSTPTNKNFVKVSTTSDTASVGSALYTTVLQNPISKPSVTISPPSAAVGARTTYSITFTTSPTGGLSGAAGSTITIAFLGDTGLTSLSSDAVTDAGTQVGGDCSVPSGSETMTCIIFNGSTVNAGDTLTVTLNGVVNPSAVSDRNFVTVSTSSDTAGVTSALYSTVAQHPISQPSVTITSPSNAAGARTSYAVTFATSATGALTGAAGSTIAITLPQNTGLTSLSSSAVIDAGNQVGGDCNAPKGSETETCIIFNGSAVKAGDKVTVVLNGVINPAASPGLTVQASTSSDTAPVTSAGYDVVAASAVTQPTVVLSNHAPGAAGVSYTVGFTTSSTGGLSGAAGSTITITFPQNTGLTSLTSNAVTDAGQQVGGDCNAPPGSETETCIIFNGSTVNPGDTLAVSFTGVTNPPTASSSETVSVSTSSDTATTSRPYGIGPAPTVTTVKPNSGPAAGGTSVTITGTNLTGASSVSFGGNLATNVKVVSDTQVSATSPSGSGRVDVTVTTLDGTSATSGADQFTYGPTVTSVAPTAGAAAGGTQVVIIGTGFTNASGVSFGNKPAVFQPVSDTRILATSPAGTGTVHITVTTPAGTSPTSAADQFTYSPAVSSLNPSSGPTAGGTSVTITGVNFTGANSVRFGAVPATSFTVDSATQITAVSPPGNVGAVDVTVGTSVDTSPKSPADRYTYVAAPTVTGVNPSQGPTAGGTSVTIIGANLAGATAVNFGNNAAGNVQVNQAGTQITATLPPGTAGTVDITVATVGGTSATGPNDQFTYSTPPPAQHTPPPTVQPAPPTVNSSSAAGLSASVNPNGSPTTVHWEYGLDPADRGPGFTGNVFDQATPDQPLGPDVANHTVVATLSNLLPNARYHVRLVAANGAGTTAGPDQVFTTAKAPTPVAPIVGKTENLTPNGLVFVLQNGRFVALTQTRQLPNGTEIDALQGSVNLVASTGKKGKSFTGTFGGAVFKITQTASGPNKGLTTLNLVEGAFAGAPSYASCKAKGAADRSATGHATLSRRILQTLRSRATGRFRTRGRYAAGTVLGTQWTTTDRCDGTLISVQVHAVQVTDLVKHLTTLVRAGHSYLARAPK